MTTSSIYNTAGCSILNLKEEKKHATEARKMIKNLLGLKMQSIICETVRKSFTTIDAKEKKIGLHDDESIHKGPIGGIEANICSLMKLPSPNDSKP